MFCNYKIYKKSKCSYKSEQLNKLYYIHLLYYYRYVQKNEEELLYLYGMNDRAYYVKRSKVNKNYFM